MLQDLIFNEIFLQRRLYQLGKYLLLFLGFSGLSLSFIASADAINTLLPIFLLVSIPLSALQIANYTLREDQNSGRLELLLTCYSSWQITLAKYAATMVHYFVVLFLIIPIFSLMMDASLSNLFLLSVLAVLLTIQAVALCITLGSVQCYFNASSNYLGLLIMPALIPAIIICGLIYSGALAADNIILLVGMDLIMVPICLYFSSYLAANIFNL